jgi:aspartyl-tRNA synthetase
MTMPCMIMEMISPDLRFEMKFVHLKEGETNLVGERNFKPFDEAEMVAGICVNGCADYTRKHLDELTDFVKRPQLGATDWFYIRCLADGTFKSSVDKFYTSEDLKNIAAKFNAVPGDLLLILQDLQEEPVKH